MRSIRMVITRNAALAMLMVALSTLGPQRASALEQSGGAAPGQACTDCKQTCSDNYPNAGGPRTTCLNLCRDGACKATSGGTNKSGVTTGGKTGVHPSPIVGASPPASLGGNKVLPSGGGATTLEKSIGGKH
jgi:hypothetical protein